MTTRIANLQENNDIRFNNKKLFNFVIVIGGVAPKNSFEMEKKLSIPSLHLMGLLDPYFEGFDIIFFIVIIIIIIIIIINNNYINIIYIIIY